MIDISDGLLQDLGHICKASNTGAAIWHEQLPLSPAYLRFAAKDGTVWALCGGEDYELLFCARPRDRAQIERLQALARVKITRIGSCVPADQRITVLDHGGNPLSLPIKGHDHFKKS
jgi:thiamine-monophosphate kinase